VLERLRKIETLAAIPVRRYGERSGNRKRVAAMGIGS